MDRETIIRLAREAAFYTPVMEGELMRFADLVAAHERNKVAAWMIDRGYATGHGDTTEDLLKELEWQIKEREREECANVALTGTGEAVQIKTLEIIRAERERIADAIRSRK